MLSTVIAAAVVVALAFVLRAKVTSSGVPPGSLSGSDHHFHPRPNGKHERDAHRIIRSPLAVTFFTFILIANWLSVVPLQYHDSTVSTSCFRPRPPTSTSRWHCSVRVPLLPRGGHLAARFVRVPGETGEGPHALLAPINLIEELSKPISLSLRLFGNMFAGGILVALIGLFPWDVLWLPNAIWKSFDLFVGAIQAFIFALLTILYFSQSMELDEESH